MEKEHIAVKAHQLEKLDNWTCSVVQTTRYMVQWHETLTNYVTFGCNIVNSNNHKSMPTTKSGQSSQNCICKEPKLLQAFRNTWSASAITLLVYYFRDRFGCCVPIVYKVANGKNSSFCTALMQNNTVLMYFTRKWMCIDKTHWLNVFLILLIIWHSVDSVSGSSSVKYEWMSFTSIMTQCGYPFYALYVCLFNSCICTVAPFSTTLITNKTEISSFL